MTGQEILMMALKYPKDTKTRDYYLKISGLYRDEFGLSWLLKEMDEARKYLQGLMLGYITVTSYYSAVDLAIKKIEKPEKNFTRQYIGSREVNLPDFVIYCKGLYWLAGYDLLNGK